MDSGFYENALYKFTFTYLLTTYSENSGLKFWVTNANKYPLLAPLAHLLSAPASEAYVERVLSLWRADSRQEIPAD